MKAATAIAGLALCLCAGALAGQLPPTLAQGLTAVKAGDYNRAIDAWTSTWQPGPGTDSSRQRLKSGLARLDPPRAWEIVRDVTITKQLHRYYVVISGERVPLFLVLEAYLRPDGTWTVEHIQYNSTLTSLPGLDVAEFLRTP